MLTSELEARGGDPDDGPGEAAPPPAPASRHRVARVVGSVGRLMMTTGVVILLLVAYQLWGTNLHTSRAQDRLGDEWDALVDETGTPTTAPASTAPSTAPEAGGPPATTPPEVAPTLAPPQLGEVVGELSIPKIGVDRFYVVEGTGVAQLKEGAAHYPGTPLPGQAGNAAIAGHRTTYGAPLHDVEQLVDGDEIIFTTVQGTFRYEVSEIKIVDPSDVSVLEDVGDDRITLTACHPKFSAEQRIIVVGQMVGNPVPTLPGQEEAAAATLDAIEGEVDTSGSTIDQFATEPALRFPGAWWGLVCMVLWGLTRLFAHLGHRSGRYPRWVPYLIGTPICLVVLYLFFESFSYEGFARTLGLSV